MPYLAYGLIVLAGVLGWYHIHPSIVLPLAMVSTALFRQSRKDNLKNDRMPAPQWVDMVYLFTLQILILFSAFALGYFLSTSLSSIPTA